MSIGAPSARDLASRDNGHSFGGLYGFANPVVTWLLSRGQGELVALTPQELKVGAHTPTCPDCQASMLWRGQEWVCYGHDPPHDPPIRRRIPPSWQKLPPCPWKALDCIGYEVDIQYSQELGEQRASWKWTRRRL